MNLSEKIKKSKSTYASRCISSDVFIITIILFVGLISFGLGRLSAVTESKIPVSVEKLTSSVVGTELSVSSPDSYVGGEEKLFVASKNGTKYHYPWCSGAQRIKEENKVWFNTKEEAEKAGYTPASNCKGL